MQLRVPGATTIEERARELRDAQLNRLHQRTDKMFAALMLVQWLFAIFISVTFSPYTWQGPMKSIHVHVLAAVFLGGALSGLPIFLAFYRAGWVGTRYVMAVAQMLWSALLIHLMGGRLETHFHVFGSLAFIAFYRDWKILVPATIVVAADHFIRQLLWPESVFGLSNPEWWRFLEHAFWVLFEDIFLFLSIGIGMREVELSARQQAEVEDLSVREREKSEALDQAMQELHRSQEILVRAEKLAAVGQLAASVSHELRNPLAAVRNASTYLNKRLSDPKLFANGTPDAKVPQFLGIIDRELGACSKIISDLLDFARTRAVSLQPCPLRPLVDEAISVIPPSDVTVKNDVPEDLAVPKLDRDQFRQILINLTQNAVEAIPKDRKGEVRVFAEGGGSLPWRISITDNGDGISKEALAKIFEPLFTTKVKGTGLGLAVVMNTVKAHKGNIEAQSEVGKGTCFTITLPPEALQQAA
jgi:two-component system sensor histidine kinase HydH